MNVGIDSNKKPPAPFRRGKQIYKELKTDPEYADMCDGELSELAREFALEEVGNYDEWLARLKFMNEEP